jgi:hypothetical protein
MFRAVFPHSNAPDGLESTSKSQNVPGISPQNFPFPKIQYPWIASSVIVDIAGFGNSQYAAFSTCRFLEPKMQLFQTLSRALFRSRRLRQGASTMRRASVRRSVEQLESRNLLATGVFTGTVSSTYGSELGITEGDPVVGTFSFDRSIADASPEPDIGTYEQDASHQLEIVINGQTFSSVGGYTIQVLNDFFFGCRG